MISKIRLKKVKIKVLYAETALNLRYIFKLIELTAQSKIPRVWH